MATLLMPLLENEISQFFRISMFLTNETMTNKQTSVTLVLIRQRIYENSELRSRNWLLDPVKNTFLQIPCSLEGESFLISWGVAFTIEQDPTFGSQIDLKIWIKTLSGKWFFFCQIIMESQKDVECNSQGVDFSKELSWLLRFSSILN